MSVIKHSTLTLFFIFSICNIYGQKDTVVYTEDGQLIKEKGQIKEGKKVGVWKEFYTDEENKGLLKREFFYNSNGFIYKSKSYFDKNCFNRLKQSGHYKLIKGYRVYHGKDILYYCNGKIKHISHYKNGIYKKSIYYYDNGVLEQSEKKTKRNSNHKRGLLVVNFKNGLPSIRGQYKKNLKKGLWKTYYENGNLKSKGKYIAKEKRIPDKNFNEIIKEKYIPNLEPIYDSLKSYEYDVTHFDNSLPLVISHKTGKWKYWNEVGNLIRVQIWKKGELLEDKKYNQNSILIKEEIWEGGVLKEIKEYDEEGNLILK